jgi:hypothetical protein
MKRYILSVGIVVLALVLAQVALFEAQLGVPSESSRWIHEAMEKKLAYADSIHQPKIVIIAGSNALFSISAEQLEEQLGVPVVNLGVHAGLKLEYILHRSIEALAPGDIVLLPLEYAAYSYDGETGATLSDFLAARDPAYLRQDSWRYLNTAFSMSFLDLIERNSWRFKPQTRVVGFYDASHINRWGDKTNLARTEMTERDKEKLTSCRPVKFEFSPNGTATRLIERFVTECRSHGVRVIITFPTTIYFEQYNDPDFVGAANRLRDHFAAKEVTVMGNPQDYMWPVDEFFNTQFHANEVGRAKTTQKLANQLGSHLPARLRNSAMKCDSTEGTAAGRSTSADYRR